MTTHEQVREAIETVTYEFIQERDAKQARDPVEINGGFCRWFLSDVLEYLGEPDDVIRHDAGWTHSWIELDGTHYDVEHPHGIDDPHEFKIWGRLTEDERTHAANTCKILNPKQIHEPIH